MGFRFVDRTLDDFKVGDGHNFSKTVTEADVVVFAGISGNMGPQHVNAVYARTSPYGERTAQEMLVSSLVSAAVARMLAPGFVSRSCQFEFVAPVRLGDTIVATVEVVEKDEKAGELKLRAECTNDRDEVVLTGHVVQATVRGR